MKIIFPERNEETQRDLLGKEVRVFKDDFSPEVIGSIKRVRGYGSLQAIEVRTHQNQPGPRVRVAFVGQWELTEGGGN